ncbi:hypothetical protein [Marinitoga lauensis]|uniref:hypothetical protein n=1 Tax=Marinitoga lauensis TaxID=2201189 RepID=UPI001013BD86|nr:hypothetical protein [Marinitoga lauensis]
MKTQKWTIPIEKLPEFTKVLKAYTELTNTKELEIDIEFENEEEKIKNFGDLIHAISTRGIKIKD